MKRSHSPAPIVFLLFALAGLSRAVEPSGLQSVYFEYGSSALSAESQKTLERHAGWLKDHADVLLEIQGWDDFYVGKGDGKLSVKRAEAVREFFVKSGVEADRMTIRDRGTAPWDPTRKTDPRTYRRVDFLALGKRVAPASSTPASAPLATPPPSSTETLQPTAATGPPTGPPVGAVEAVPSETAPAREPAKPAVVPKKEAAPPPEPAKKETPPTESHPKPEAKEPSASVEKPPKPVPAATEAKAPPVAPDSAKPPDKTSEPPKAEKPAPPPPPPQPVAAAAPPREPAPPAATPPAVVSPPLRSGDGERKGIADSAPLEPEPPREEKIEQAWMKWRPSNVGPKPRWGHGMIFDESNGRVILHGGTNGKQIFGDLWEFDLKTTRWAPLQPGGGDPGPLAFHSAVYDPKAKRMIVFGGSSNLRDTTDAVWSLSLKRGSESWVKIEFPVSPGPRAAQSTTYEERSHQLVIFGGCAKNLKACLYSNDLWGMDLKVGGESWAALPSASPLPGERESAMMFAKPDGDLVVIGGFNVRGYLKDSWVYDGQKRNWTPLESPLSARCCSTYHVTPKGMVFFGGNDRRNYYQDTWWSNGKEFKEYREPSVPPARAFSRMVPTGEPNMYFLFGGQSVSGALGDFWMLKLK